MASAPMLRAGRWTTSAAAVIGLLLFATAPVQGQSVAGYSEYILPGDEQLMYYAFNDLDANAGSTNMHAVTSVTAWSAGTIIYYDHWENGYNFDPANPEATADERYVLANAGDVLVFESPNIPYPGAPPISRSPAATCAGQLNPLGVANPGSRCYDGGDRIYVAGGTATVARAVWIDAVGVGNQGDAWEIYPVKPQLTTYVLPFGEDLYASSAAYYRGFERVYALIQATEDGTTFTVDLNHDGAPDILNQNRDANWNTTGPGTVGATSGSTAVVGTGTTFTTSVYPGQPITIAGVPYTVQSVTNNTNLTLTTAYTGGTAGGLAYIAGDGTTVTLQKGQTFLLDRISACRNHAACTTNPGTLNTGAVIQGNKTLQVKYVTGLVGTTYGARGLSAFPRGFWTNSYYGPLDQPANCDNGITDYYLFNPGNAPLTVNWESETGSGSFQVAANGTQSYNQALGLNPSVPQNSGVYFNAASAFWGVGFSDATATGGGGTGCTPTGKSFEWGFSLLPTTFLYKEHYFGWAPGSYPPRSSANANWNGNGVFLTPAQDNTTVFVHYPDGTADATYTLNRLQSQFVPPGTTNGSLTGAHFWATGDFTMAYGENPDTAAASTPGIDLGYVALPATDFVSLVLTTTKTANPPVVSTASGSTTVFTVKVDSHAYTVDGVSVVDTLPPNWQYVYGTTTITKPDLTRVTGVAADPAVAGNTLTWSTGQTGGNMGLNQEIVIQFTAQTTAIMNPGTLSRNDVSATGTRTVGSGPADVQTFTATDFTFVTSGAAQITKTSSAPTPLYPGDSFTYTVTVTNPAVAGTNLLTGVSVYDPVPGGATNVTGTTTLSLSTVADSFNTQVYTNASVGTRGWASNWFETDAGGAGQSPTAGNVRVTAVGTGGFELRIHGAATQQSAARAVNLTTPSTATVATLAFRYHTANAVAGDQFLVQGGTAGTGGAFTTIPACTITGLTGAQSGTASCDISTYIGLNTAVRLATAANSYTSVGAAYFYVDDVSITYDVSVTPAPNPNPPDLVPAAYLYSLVGGQSLQVTYNVTVDNPFPTGQTSLTNTAATTSVQLPIQLTASVTDIVSNPGRLTATVAGRLWLDANGNAAQDVGEPGIGNVQVTLTDQYGTPVASAWTDSNGRFLFTGVSPGNGYYVEATAPPNPGGQPLANLSQTFPASPPCAYCTTTFNLTAGQDYTGADEGYAPAAGTVSFGDLAWVDANGNGLRDAGEASLAGVKVRLFRDANANGTLDVLTDTPVGQPTLGPGTLAATNGSTGIVGTNTAFRDLAPGDPITIEGVPYTISTITDDTHLTLTTGYAGATGSSLVYLAATNPGAGTISVTNGQATVVGNGTTFTNLLPGDPVVILGVRYRVASIADDTHLTLTANYPGATNAAVAYGVMTPMTTRADGSYLFTGVTPAGQTYFVSATTPTGYTATTPTSFTFANVTGGTAYLTADFGFKPGASLTLSDRVWADTSNANTPGTVTTTAGSSAVTGSGTLFKNLNPGDPLTINSVQYTIASIADDTHLTLTSNAGGNFTGAYLALGTWDATESGISGVTVELLDASATVIGTTTTGAGGVFTFSGLVRGASYTTRISDSGGVLADYYGTSSYGIARTRLFPNLTVSVDLTPTPSYGFFATRSIGQTVFADLNGSGAQDASEPGISSVVVTLYRDLGNGIGTTAPGNTITTNGTTAVVTGTGTAFLNYHANEPFVINGVAYTIASVTNATHLTLTTIPPAYTGTVWRAPNTSPGTVTNGAGATAVTGTGTFFTRYQAGEPITIAGTVYTIASITDDTHLTLTAAIAAAHAGVVYYGPAEPLATATTDAFGQYLFSGLPAGAYVVSVQTPAGYTYVPGGRTDTDGNFPGIQLTSTIAGSSSDFTRNFGFQPPVTRSISGTIWNDANSNDVIDAGETGRFAGVTVNLVSGSTVLQTTSTDANGNFTFTGLAPGTYTVQVTDTGGVLNGYYETVARSWQRTVDVTGANATNQNFGYAKPAVTYAAIAYLRAYRSGGSVVAEWRTTQEVGTVGFHLLRYDGGADTYVPVRQQMVPALLVHPQGGLYRLEDAGAPPEGSVQYALVEVDARGRERVYGPYTVPVLQQPPADERPRDSAYERRPNHPSSRRLAVLHAVSAERQAAAIARRPRAGQTLKITTRQAGLHYLSTPQLAGATGLTAEAVSRLLRERRLAMSHRGRAVSYLPAGESGLYFYAAPLSSPYTLEDVYWLTVAPGLVMAAAPSVSSGAAVATFPEAAHQEVDQYPTPAFFHDPQGDFWVWDYLVAGEDGLDTKSFGGQASGVSGSGSASLSLRLVGVGEHHHVEVSLNGSALGDATWDGTGPHEASFPISASAIAEGTNTVELRATLEGDTPYSIVYMNSFDLCYERLYRAASDQFAFTAPPASSVTITGLPASTPILLDVTQPETPVLITGGRLSRAADGTTTLEFAPGGHAQGDRRYLALGVNQARSPVSVEAWKGTGLSDRRNAASYLLIAPASLRQAAQALADYRQSQGTRTMVVGLESIYDEFDAGIAEPQAIQRFLRFAASSWAEPPRQVTLVGKGTFDYRNLLGYGDNLVPTELVDSPDGLVASDVALADASATPDGVPETAIGRIPALTSQDLLDYLAKVEAQEAGEPAPWQMRVLLAADDPDAGGDFPADSDALAGLVPADHPVTKVYLGASAPIDANRAVVQAIHDGVGLFNYLGHGGLDRLADESLLSNSDVPALGNTGRLPVFLAMTCSVGNFAIPGYASLSETMLLRKDGGAYAVWAPSGLSENPVALKMDAAFLRAAFGRQRTSMGAAVVYGLKTLAPEDPLFMRQMYNLLGEPVGLLPQ